MTGRTIARATRALPLLLAAAMFVLSLAHHHPATPDKTGSAPKPCGVCVAGGDAAVLQALPSVARTFIWTALPSATDPATFSLSTTPESSRAPPAHLL